MNNYYNYNQVGSLKGQIVLFLIEGKKKKENSFERWFFHSLRKIFQFYEIFLLQFNIAHLTWQMILICYFGTQPLSKLDLALYLIIEVESVFQP